MRYRRSMMISRVSAIALPCLILSFFPGFISSAVVTLKSIEIYNTHQWMPRKPKIYFQCSSDNKTFLPDVKEANVLYSFKGEESWQPLTELLTQKCKRCGIYQDLIMSDYTFEEWELCPSDFAGPDGNYTRFKEDEFNAIFHCEECSSLDKDSPPDAEESDRAGERKHHVVPIILLTVATVVVVVLVSVAAFKYWQKRKRQQEQARFLKLFEEDDDMDDELGLKEML